MTKFPPGRPSFCRRISRLVCDSLSGWNDLLPKFNSILFFYDKRQKTYRLYTDASWAGLESFYYKHSSVFWTNVIIEQNTTFVAMTKNCKSGHLPHKSRESIIRALPQGHNVQIWLLVNINVFEVEEILLGFHLQVEK